MGKRTSALGGFVLATFLGLVIFVVFSHIRPVLYGAADLIGRLSLLAGLGFISLTLGRHERWQPYRRMLWAGCTAGAATALDYYLPTIHWLLTSLNVGLQTPLGIALDKLDSSVIIVLTILLINRLSGGDRHDLYLQKGNLRKGLAIGISAFLLCAAGSIFVATAFGADNLSIGRIIPWIPWILVFILANAFNEELLFRGLFLGNLSGPSGKLCANLAVSIPFVLHHTGVTYTNDSLLFLAYLLPLSLVWGYLMQDTKSLLASVLFHAGTDIPVILVIFSRMA